MKPRYRNGCARASHLLRRSRDASGAALTLVALISGTALPAQEALAQQADATRPIEVARPNASTDGLATEPLELKPTLARLAAAKTSDQIEVALSDLALLADEAAAPHIEKYLANPDPAVAEQAAAALESIGGKPAIAALDKALKQPMPPKNTSRTLEALYFLRTNGDVLPGLLLGLRSPDAQVRRDAAYYLGQLADRRAVPELRGQLQKETDPTTREMIAWAAAFANDETNDRPPGS
jgi:HEAT repeat protein